MTLFIVIFEQISHTDQVFPLMSLNEWIPAVIDLIVMIITVSLIVHVVIVGGLIIRKTACFNSLF